MTHGMPRDAYSNGFSQLFAALNLVFASGAIPIPICWVSAHGQSCSSTVPDDVHLFSGVWMTSLTPCGGPTIWNCFPSFMSRESVCPSTVKSSGCDATVPPHPIVSLS